MIKWINDDLLNQKLTQALHCVGVSYEAGLVETAASAGIKKGLQK